MPKFTEFNAGLDIASQTGSRNATGADYGGDLGLGALGKGIGDFGKGLKIRQDKRDITAARAQFADFQVDQSKKRADLEASAAEGADGHVESTQAEYDQDFEKFNAGLNDTQRRALAPNFAAQKVGTAKRAIAFQAQESVRADFKNIKTIQKGINTQVFDGTLTIAQAEAQLTDALTTTTIPTDKQSELVTAAGPQLRASLTTGLLDDPVGRGYRALTDGSLDGMPEAEKVKYRDDLAKAALTANTKAKNFRFLESAAINNKMYKVLIGGGTLADLDAAYRKKPVDVTTYNMMREMIIDQNRPQRSVEEMTDTSASVSAEYNQLQIVKKKGVLKANSSTTTEDLYRFQIKVTELAQQGYLTKGAAATYINDVEKVLQRKNREGGTSMFLLDDWETPWNLGQQDILDHADLKDLPVNRRNEITRNFMKLLDGGADISDSKDSSAEDKIHALAQKAIAMELQQKHPSVRSLPVVPNAVIGKNGKVSKGPTGKTGLKVDVKLPSNTVTLKLKTGETIRTTKNPDGSYSKANAVIISDKDGTPVEAPPAQETSSGLEESVRGEVVTPGSAESVGLEEVSRDEIKEQTPKETGVSAEEVGLEEVSRDEIKEQTPKETGVSAEEVGLEETLGKPAVELTPSDKAISDVTANLLVHEGEGDTLTDTPTRKGGLTDARKSEIEASVGRPMSDEAARKEAVHQDSVKLHDMMPGFSTLDSGVQAAILDLAYNVGVNDVLSFPMLQLAVASGDPGPILMHTLDTALVGGKTVRGLAKRRAIMFNKAIGNPKSKITHVEQLNDGTINYLRGSSVVLTFKRPRHEGSDPGRIAIQGGN